MKNSRRFRWFLEGVVTALLWGACIFIGVVLAKRIFAIFDFTHGASEIPFIFSSISVYIAVPLGITLVFILWRFLNIIQYRSRRRRRANIRFHEKPLWLYGLNKRTLFELRNRKNQTVLFDKKTSLIHLKDRPRKLKKDSCG